MFNKWKEINYCKLNKICKIIETTLLQGMYNK